MRVLLAGICCVVTLFLSVGILLRPLQGKLSESVAMLLIIPIFFLVIFASYLLFNKRNEHWPYPTVEELENQGLVESTEFNAQRAFQVEEFEDEGIHYYLELENGSVLFLSGQYLYGYEPISDDPEVNQERKFPSTRFVVKRHKTEGHVLEIVTDGIPLEPEIVAPPFSNSDYRLNTIPEDGEIIRNLSFEELKQQRLSCK